MLRIVTDGAADFPPEWLDEYDIHVIPLMIRFGDEVYLQGETIDEAGFYRLVEEKRIIPKTSLPSPGQIQAFYRQVADPGDTILSIHVSRKLSGTFATVEMAAEEIKNEFDIHPFDSASGSMSMGFMAREARLMERAGATIRQILARLEEMRARQTVIFTMDNLEFAHMNGRVSAIQSLLTQALKVKPILILKDGLLDMADKVRTRQRSLEKVLEYVREQVGEKRLYLAVVHAADLEGARAMLARAREMFNIQELVITTLTIPVAANLGPGSIGIVAIPVKEG